MDDNATNRIELEDWHKANWQRLGFSVVDATHLAMGETGVDYHDVEKFLKDHPTCDPHTALEIVR